MAGQSLSRIMFKFRMT